MSSEKAYIKGMRRNEENELAHAAKVLSDPIRIRILTMLKEGRRETDDAPACAAVPGAVCPADLQTRMGDITPSKLSYHLKELKEEGFIQECREGKRIYYFLQTERFERMIAALGKFYK